MDPSLAVPVDVGALCAMALTIGFVHTLLGPDHYVPFVAMSQAGRWSLAKTIAITLLCGFGHVGGSIALGLIGVGLGIVLLQLETIEAIRGDVAGWLLLIFGLGYFLWGIGHAIRQSPHRHISFTRYGIRIWEHEHHASQEVAQSEDKPPHVPGMTPWVLVIIFVLGPCEPLIPMLMYPAAKANVWAMVCVASLFGIATLVTMTAMVVIMRLGVRRFQFSGLQHYAHAACGLAIFACGLTIKLGF